MTIVANVRGHISELTRVFDEAQREPGRVLANESSWVWVGVNHSGLLTSSSSWSQTPALHSSPWLLLHPIYCPFCVFVRRTRSRAGWGLNGLTHTSPTVSLGMNRLWLKTHDCRCQILISLILHCCCLKKNNNSLTYLLLQGACVTQVMIFGTMSAVFAIVLYPQSNICIEGQDWNNLCLIWP